MIQGIRLNIPPEITTDRLLLRAPGVGDGATIIDAMRASLPELKPWLHWAKDDYGVADAEDWCRRAAASFITGEEATYIVFHSETIVPIATLSSWSKGWDVPKFEIGYWLATSHTGHGYMTEAVVALTKMTFEAMTARRIEIRTDEKNSRSRRVAERSGYLLEGIMKNDCRDVTGALRDTCVYAVTR
jgi:RimJ/RimL family protein N-acetyltransferase